MISGSWAGPQIGDSSTMRLPTRLWSLSSGRLHLGYGRRDRLTRIDTGGRRKIRMAHMVNSALALSTTRLHKPYFLSYVRQRIHFGFDAGLSQVAHPLPPT